MMLKCSRAGGGEEFVVEDVKKKGHKWRWVIGVWLVVSVILAVVYVLHGGVSAE